MRWIDSVKSALRRFRFPAMPAMGYGLLPGTRIDYSREAGNLWENSVVGACLRTLCVSFTEAPLVVRRADGTLDAEHPAARLLAEPNSAYDGTILLTGCLTSLHLDGNAYLVPVQSGLGTAVELWYVPHTQMRPIWSPGGERFLDGYEYRVDGERSVLPPESVIHLRFPVMDPANPRRGFSPLRPVLREVFTDNEAASFSAALMRAPLLGAIVSPETGGEMSPDQCQELRKLWLDRFGSDNRGAVLVSSRPLSVQSPPQLTADKVLLDRVRKVPEERICAALGVPPIIVGMGAGLARSTFANYRESREAFVESTILPLQRSIAMQLTAQLGRLVAMKPGERFAFDTREVRVLQEDEHARWDRLGRAVESGLLSRDEARSMLGLQGAIQESGGKFE